MKYYSFSNGDSMPALGLGTWKSQKGEVYQAVHEAVKVGYRHIDCAAIYGNEAEIGQAFSDLFKQGIVKREDLWITSKLWNSAHEEDRVIPALEKTLADLQLDYLDLYLVHWPVALKHGTGFPTSADEFLSIDKVPIAATWKKMENIRNSGKARHIGVSNFSVIKIKTLLASCSIKPEVNQVELHPYLQQNDLLEFCTKEGMILTAYSPLGSDLPKGDAPNIMNDPVISAIANNHGTSNAQVLIAWAIQRGTSVIPKSVKPDRIKQNFEAANLKLSADEMKQIAVLDKHLRYIAGGLWCMPGSGITYETLWDEKE
ncbi:MAG: aldo/keto reductase [Cyclobacteriaceae bacterium]|nr:aldo/keto reductase [Cyclobacteriaceae bacterium]